MFVVEPGVVRVLNSGYMLSCKGPSYIGLGTMASQAFLADLSSVGRCMKQAKMYVLK